MSLNRVLQPNIEKIKSLNFKYFEHIELACGAPIYYLSGGTEPVIKFELVFDAGKAKELKPSVASFTASMMNEGTQKRSGKTLIDDLDYWGAHFQVKTFNDDAVATLYCLEKYLDGALPLFIEALTESVFPEKELAVLKRNAVERLKINNKKNEYICRTSFNELIYGIKHPLGKKNTVENVLNIDRNELFSFYNDNYSSGFKYAILTGKFSQETLNKTQNVLNGSALKYKAKKSAITEITVQEFGKHRVEAPNKSQASLKIGKIAPERNNHLFTDFQVLNLVFGGFFGSRLMKKIREDLGLTYGIHSYYEAGKILNIWSIEAEVNNKNKELAVSEIHKELEKIINDAIPSKEIEVARNYLCGAILKSLDNPLSMSSRMKTHIDYDLDSNYMKRYIDEIYSVNAVSLTEVAAKYLSNEQLIEVIVS